MSQYQSYKQQVLEYSQSLARRGLLVGTGGNLSTRVEGEDVLAITPSGRDYLTMRAEDICIYDFERQRIEGELPPSVEMSMHIAVYQARPDTNAVIHTHQPFASAYALINHPIPALFDEQVANLGNCIEVVPYGLSGSLNLLNNITAHLQNQCNAYILQNHGILCLGMSIEGAAINVQLLEKCAQVYYYALSSGQHISNLPPQSEAVIFEMLKSEQRKEIRRKRKLMSQKDKAPQG